MTQTSGASRRENAESCLMKTNAPRFQSSSPPEPVIGLAEGETRWRGMTVQGGAVACAQQ